MIASGYGDLYCVGENLFHRIFLQYKVAVFMSFSIIMFCISLQPFGDATLGKAGLVLIPIFVAFSTFGAANGSVYTSSRLIFGAARDRLLPDCFSALHTKYKTPVPALIFLVSSFIIALYCLS